MSPAIEIVRLKITPDHVKPTVMRQIEVPVSITLDTLHEMIQAIMPWKTITCMPITCASSMTCAGACRHPRTSIWHGHP